MNRTRITRTSAGGVALLIAALVACVAAVPRGALAQSSSATRTLTSGALIGAGGDGSSATRGIIGEMGTQPGSGRGSSATRDAVPGIMGGAFSSQVTMQVSTGAGAYAAVAFPVTGTNNTVGGVLDELGPYKNTVWRFGHWSPADSAYMEPGTALDLAGVSNGLGYWLITKNASTVSATGLPAPVLPFRQALVTHPGTPTRAAWNQVGNPFLFPVDVSGLQVTDGISTFALTNPANTLTDNVVKGWTGSGFVDVTVLDGRESYWVRTRQGTSNVTLVFPYAASASGSPAPALAKPEGADWAVALIARQGNRRAEAVMVGASSLEPGLRRSLDHAAVPLPPGGRFVSLRMPREDWSDGYVREFRPQAEHMTWDLLAQGAEVPGEIALEFRSFGAPAGSRFWLTDPATGTTQELEPGTTVAVAATESPRALRLEAAVSGGGTSAAAIDRDALRFAYPNPFAATTGLAFALARPGDIRVEVYDVAGRRVRLLEKRGQAPGEHVLVWDGRDERGAATPSGVYLARYRAGAASGVRRLVRVE